MAQVTYDDQQEALPFKNEANRWMFDYDELYWTIKANLQGGWPTRDAKGNPKVYVPPEAIPFMNQEGIENTMSTLNGFVSKIGALSVYDDEERIKFLCGEIMEVLDLLYYRNLDRYELTEEKWPQVVLMICSNVESNLRKSLRGATLQMIAATDRTVESIAPQQPANTFMGIPLPKR